MWCFIYMVIYFRYYIFMYFRIYVVMYICVFLIICFYGYVFSK